MDAPTLLRLAQWFERRIDATVGFELPAARLYGIILNDPVELASDTGSAARASFIADHADVDALLSGSQAVVARSFDAAALVTSGWAVDARQHRQRRRVRVVALVADPGVRSVTRFADAPHAPVAMSERGTGVVVDALEALWFGDPFALVRKGASDGSTLRGCTRRT